MARFHELFARVGTLPTSLQNAITDVEGVRIGHVTLIEGEGALQAGKGPIRTGVTAILPHSGNIFREKVTAAVHTINGFGKAVGFEQVRELGVIETPILLTNTLNVGRVADALISVMIEQNADIGITTSSINPLVGETNDGYLNDLQGRHVGEMHVREAISKATHGPVSEGNVGAGTGTQCYGFKGGIGTASRQVKIDGQVFTIGALLQTNFGAMRELLILGAPVGKHFADMKQAQMGPGSVMIVLATNAPLDARQLGRLARRAIFGLARTGTIGDHGSGDFVIAFSTTHRWRHDQPLLMEEIGRITERGDAMDTFFTAVVECVEEAVYNALIAAQTMTGRDGHTLQAIPQDTLRELLKHYRRIE